MHKESACGADYTKEAKEPRANVNEERGGGDPWVLVEKKAWVPRPETLADPEARSTILVQLEKTRGRSWQRAWQPCEEESGRTLPPRGFGISTLNLSARTHDTFTLTKHFRSAMDVSTLTFSFNLLGDASQSPILQMIRPEAPGQTAGAQRRRHSNPGR